MRLHQHLFFLLCERFEKRTPQDLDDIICELNDYRVMSENHLPVDDDGGDLYQFWFLMGKIQKPGDLRNVLVTWLALAKLS